MLRGAVGQWEHETDQPGTKVWCAHVSIKEQSYTHVYSPEVCGTVEVRILQQSYVSVVLESGVFESLNFASYQIHLTLVAPDFKA